MRTGGKRLLSAVKKRQELISWDDKDEESLKCNMYRRRAVVESAVLGYGLCWRLGSKYFGKEGTEIHPGFRKARR
jgi:hypothetical protein